MAAAASASAKAAKAAKTGNHGVYDILVGLHVVCAVVGFGAVAISGAYGAIGRRPGGSDGGARTGSDGGARTGSTEEVNRFFTSPNRAEYLLVVAPLFGIAAMSVRPGGSEFGDLWAIFGFVVWVVASALLVGVVRPAEAEIRSGRGAGGGSAGGGAAAGGWASPAVRLMWAGAACDLLFVAALMMMVIQPG